MFKEALCICLLPDLWLNIDWFCKHFNLKWTSICTFIVSFGENEETKQISLCKKRYVLFTSRLQPRGGCCHLRQPLIPGSPSGRLGHTSPESSVNWEVIRPTRKLWKLREYLLIDSNAVKVSNAGHSSRSARDRKVKWPIASGLIKKCFKSHLCRQTVDSLFSYIVI